MLDDFIKKADKVQRTIEIIENGELPYNWKSCLVESLKDEDYDVVINIPAIIFRKTDEKIVDSLSTGILDITEYATILNAVIESLGDKESERWKAVFPKIREIMRKNNIKVAENIISGEKQSANLASLFKDLEAFLFFIYSLSNYIIEKKNDEDEINEFEKSYKSDTRFIVDNIIALKELDKIGEEYVIKLGDNQKISKMKNILDDFLVDKGLDGLASSFQNDVRNRNESYINWKKADQEHMNENKDKYAEGWSINFIKSLYEEAFEFGSPLVLFRRQLEDFKDFLE